jgi:hypothetical protein
LDVSREVNKLGGSDKSSTAVDTKIEIFPAGAAKFSNEN